MPVVGVCLFLVVVLLAESIWCIMCGQYQGDGRDGGMSTWQDGNRHDVWFRRLPFPKTTAVEGGSFRGRARTARLGRCCMHSVLFHPIQLFLFVVFWKGASFLIDGLMDVEDPRQ